MVHAWGRRVKRARGGRGGGERGGYQAGLDAGWERGQLFARKLLSYYFQGLPAARRWLAVLVEFPLGYLAGRVFSFPLRQSNGRLGLRFCFDGDQGVAF
jgi:hypothetical protein